MGIYGALATAVSGLTAQSFALSNISGNIANSQTTAYKRNDTEFLDLVTASTGANQSAGSVLASAHQTLDISGDITNVASATSMAINGSGFFAVEPKLGENDGRAVFSGGNFYTRRGDFELDKDGYLVNGSGYYLKGLPIDSTTGNVSGSVPSVIQVSNAFLPAQGTTRIDYNLNLPQLPVTASYDSSVPNSELLNPSTYGTAASPATNATETGTVSIDTSTTAATHAAVTGTADLSGGLTDPGSDVTFSINGTTVTLTTGSGSGTGGNFTLSDIETAINGASAGVTASDNGTYLTLTSTGAAGSSDTLTTSGLATAGLGISDGTVSGSAASGGVDVSTGSQSFTVNGQTVTLSATGGTNSDGHYSASDIASAINGVSGSSNVTATVNAGQIVLTSTGTAGSSDAITLAGLSSAGLDTALGLADGTVNGTNAVANTTYDPTTNGTGTVLGRDGDTFLSQSIAGGAVTVYADNGSSADVQFRWAKTDSASNGGTDTWNLYYLKNSDAGPGDVMWQNAGQDFTFGPDGQLSSGNNAITLSGLTINGTSVGDVDLGFGATGLTEFANANGSTSVNVLSQNGYAAGQFDSVNINDNGRVVATYSNGEQSELAQIVVADFNAPNQLQKMDGGVYSATSESGNAIVSTDGSRIKGGAIEGSNTDISNEFTKLIVTQQAYAAGTKIVTTSNDMLQQALNMIR